MLGNFCQIKIIQRPCRGIKLNNKNNPKNKGYFYATLLYWIGSNSDHEKLHNKLDEIIKQNSEIIRHLKNGDPKKERAQPTL